VESAEDVLEAQKAGKTPSGPLGLNCSTETSNSSSFWRGVHHFLLADDEESRMFMKMREA
jgi:hypothetical protein